MGTGSRFDASPPMPYAKEDWRTAYRADPADSPRAASYQAPGGMAVPFIQKGFRFSGGQSRDTAEYPFGGLWSHEYLNEKPQTLTVEGYLRGPAYIVQRNKLVEALRVPTGDDNPGYIDLPFWGRFPVVVDDHYEIAESTDEQGQCAVSLSFRRAGVSITERMAALPSAGIQVEKAIVKLQTAAIDDFEARLAGAAGSPPGGDSPGPGDGGDGGGSDPGGGDSGGANSPLDTATFASGFSQLKATLLTIIGRIQGAKTTLNTMTGKVLGITSLINQGIRSPRELAQALFNAGTSIAGGVLEIKNSIALYGQTAGMLSGNGAASSNPELPSPDNEKNVLLFFLEAGGFTLSVDTATVSQTATKTAVENLFRTMAFWVSAQIIINYDRLTRRKAEAYWRLMGKLEESVNRENPAVYAALQETRTALSRDLSEKELSGEMTRSIPAASPLLYVAYYLGCDEDKIRELNSIPDSFAVEGGVVYV
jgi:hypothetical protein